MSAGKARCQGRCTRRCQGHKAKLITIVEPLTWGVGFKCFALHPRHLWFLNLIFTIRSLCYHAATRTGKTSAICAHVRSNLLCWFLVGLDGLRGVSRQFLNRGSRIRLRRQPLEFESGAMVPTMVGSPRLHHTHLWVIRRLFGVVS